MSCRKCSRSKIRRMTLLALPTNGTNLPPSTKSVDRDISPRNFISRPLGSPLTLPSPFFLWRGRNSTACVQVQLKEMAVTNGTSPSVPHRERANTTSTNYSFAKVSDSHHTLPSWPILGRRKGSAEARFCPAVFILGGRRCWTALDVIRWQAHDHFPALHQSTNPLTKFLRRCSVTPAPD